MKKGEKVGLYLSGQPVQIEDCNIAITQPTIKDVVVYGEDEFLICVNILGHPENIVNQMKQGNSELAAFDDFQLLLVVLRQEPTIKQSIIDLFNLIFPEYEIKFEDASIDFYIIQEEQKRLVGRIHAFNFSNFQEIINDLFEPVNEGDVEYNPVNDAAAEIAAKLKAGRERKKQQNAEREGPQSLFGRYTSILAIGMQMDINIFYSYTPFQLYDAFNRYFAKVQSDFYTKVSTTPLMDVSKMETPEDWVRNLYK